MSRAVFRKQVLGTVGYLTAGLDLRRTRVALISYSRTPQLVFNLGEKKSQKALQAAIRRAPYRKGRRRTFNAALLLRRMVVPRVRRGRRHVVVLVTSGRSTRGLSSRKIRRAFRKSRAKVLTIGVSKRLGGFRCGLDLLIFFLDTIIHQFSAYLLINISRHCDMFLSDLNLSITDL